MLATEDCQSQRPEQKRGNIDYHGGLSYRLSYNIKPILSILFTIEANINVGIVSFCDDKR